MFKNLSRINQVIRKLHNPVVYNLDPYSKVLVEIDKIKLGTLSDSELKAMSEQLKNRARAGVLNT